MAVASVVVMADAPRPGACNVGLEPRLGPNGCALLQAELIRVAVGWGHALGPTAVVVFPPDAVDEVDAPAAIVVGAVGESSGARVVAAVGQADPPVVVIGTAMPTLGRFHADAVESDLEAGVDVAIAPSHDGGFYLVALREPRPDLFVDGPDAWDGRAALARLLTRATELQLEAGMLRGERKLESPADAAALLLHHALPESVAERLRVPR
jgi:uncharacterized protein